MTATLSVTTIISESGAFLDSNIWLYAISKESENPDNERRRVSAISLIQNENLVTSFQVINEVCANAIRKLAFSEEQIRNLITSFYTSCFVIEQNRNLLTEASQLRTQYRFSFWDSLIVASALQSNVNILYSEDMQDGLRVNNQLEIINPFK